MDRNEIINWLRETNDQRLEQLWRQADDTRRRAVGDEVHLRGLIEISNVCARSCLYCGLRAPNAKIERYRLSDEEILDCAAHAVQLGYGTVVMQSGEDYGVQTDRLARLIHQIKSDTPLAVTLSLGERPDRDLLAWRQAGADRYLLRFETSNPKLYKIIHPDLNNRPSDRIAILRRLDQLGYEVGSGVMVGIPGQSYDDLADDIVMFRELRLHMIGVGPWLPHPDTPLAQMASQLRLPPDRQVPNDEITTYKAVALARLACPWANIPSTTALATVNQANGRELGLVRGANVVMPNLTPLRYRPLYEIYPAKACLQESPDDFHLRLRSRIHDIGRTVGAGRGDSKRQTNASSARQAETGG